MKQYLHRSEHPSSDPADGRRAPSPDGAPARVPEVAELLPIAAGMPRTDARRLRVPWWVAVGVVTFVAGLAMDAFAGVNPSDEAWFLYVLHRVNAGDALYREIWFHALPLAVWFGAAVTRVLGEQVLVLKALSTAFFSATALLCAWTGRRLGMRRAHTALLVLAMLAFAPPGVVGPGSLYSAMAFALLAAVGAATMWWLEGGGGDRRRPVVPLLVAFGLAGLAFATKQDVGAYALVALTVVAVAAERRRLGALLPQLLVGSALAAAVVGVALAPVVLSGSGERFIYDNVTSKRAYFENAGATYAGGAVGLARKAWRPESAWVAGEALRDTAFLLPLLALPLALLAWARTRDPRRGVLLAFALAAFAGTFPRSDYNHVAAALPFLATAVLSSWTVLRPSVPRVLRAAAAVSLAVLVLARLAFAVGEIARVYDGQPVVFARIRHFALAPFPRDQARYAVMSIDALKEQAAGRPVYITGLRAGLLYLAAELEDPTRYDYPAGSAIGSEGQQEIILGLRTGRIAGVYHDDYSAALIPGFQPIELHRFVTRHLTPGPPYPYGRLWLAEPSPSQNGTRAAGTP